jgi:hypothetical protein
MEAGAATTRAQLRGCEISKADTGHSKAFTTNPQMRFGWHRLPFGLQTSRQLFARVHVGSGVETGSGM